jgi:uncharacterized protein with HEPN domain
MKGPEADQLRVRHILDAISEVEIYLRDISESDFMASSEKRFATIKQIEIIGEACNRLSAEFKTAHPEIPWKPLMVFEIFPFTNISELIFTSSGKSPV